MPNYPKKRATKTYKKGTYKRVGSSSVKKQIKRALVAYTNKNVEVKKSVSTSTDGAEIYHNSFITLDSTMLYTSQGITDPTQNSYSNRIGDEVKLRGINIKMFVELNERYSQCQFRFIVVKCAKGDTPTRTTLFNNLSGNKMIDTFNRERFTILYSKNFKINAPNYGTTGAEAIGPGYNAGAPVVLSRASKVLKIWLPYKVFSKSGKITYENGSSQPKFYDYHALLYAYTNYSTYQDVYFVARCNDYIKTMYFTDQ